MNVDAAISQDAKSIGVGAIIRNSSGEVMAALAKWIDGCFSSKVTETKALGLSLLWAKDVGLNLQVVESDALTVVQALQTSSICNSEFGALLLDVFSLLFLFHGVCVRHVYRDANRVAHELAKYALRLDDELIWLEDVPPPVLSVVFSDLSN
ncbi:Ribonuclease H [Parasponia andersonii]|uniref:Ribonuclease H n=1 Tax=Parasponia andersonii TaxID=3476 RepID=A0A2P5BPF4_PARAD|nr:Ribonuclease H [Parasponia andersonii]